MSDPIAVSLVCCDTSPRQLSTVVAARLDRSFIEAAEFLLHKERQQLLPGQAKNMHLAVSDQWDQKVTFLQEIHDGGFYVYVGDPSCLQEHYFGPGSWVAFNDDQGAGHASKVGPSGCTRTMRVLSGHFKNQIWPSHSE